jgi:deoxyribonucleoside regulator
MRTIGRSAAERLVSLLKDGDILGITWGATVNEVVKALPLKVDNQIEVVQITGGLDQMAIDVNAMDIVRRIAAVYDAEIHVLHAPAFVTSKTAREALLSNGGIQKTVDMFEKVNVAVSGIGAFSDQVASNLLLSGNLFKEDIARLRSLNAVGDVFGHFFDIDGQICATELEERIMGMNIDLLKKIHYSIGVAGGRHKSKAILGALRGKLINILVTDRLTACEILKQDGYPPSCDESEEG